MVIRIPKAGAAQWNLNEVAVSYHDEKKERKW